jgi:hypothetical protein
MPGNSPRNLDKAWELKAGLMRMPAKELVSVMPLRVELKVSNHNLLLVDSLVLLPKPNLSKQPLLRMLLRRISSIT